MRFRFALANNHIIDGVITSSQQEVRRGEVIVRGFVNPTVVVSTCIEFDHCRWNGGIVVSHIVNQLMTVIMKVMKNKWQSDLEKKNLSFFRITKKTG